MCCPHRRCRLPTSAPRLLSHPHPHPQAVSAKAEEIAAVKADAERDLAEAKPALDAALAALNSISPKDISSLKALKSPPDVVRAGGAGWGCTSVGCDARTAKRLVPRQAGPNHASVTAPDSLFLPPLNPHLCRSSASLTVCCCSSERGCRWGLACVRQAGSGCRRLPLPAP